MIALIILKSALLVNAVWIKDAFHASGFPLRHGDVIDRVQSSIQDQKVIAKYGSNRTTSAQLYKYKPKEKKNRK